jgi:DNA-directed RNA polymerase subunit M/transcription elongation factor TFIIS
MYSLNAFCQNCKEQQAFYRIGNNKPLPFECVECGYIQRGPHCPDCGSTQFYHLSPLRHVNHCRSCGCGKQPVWKKS